MILLIIFAAILGICAGIITGLAPGIHINFVALMLFVNSAWLLKFTTPIILAVFIVAMSISHAFFDFLPSILLGAPEESTALSVLPGHRLLLEGRGYEAIKITSMGGMIGIVIILMLFPVFTSILPFIYSIIKKFIPFVLILASAFLILREEKSKKVFALIFFVLSGILGIFTLNNYIIKQPLFPLLTGLFGTSMLAISIKQKVKIPRQNFEVEKIKKEEIGKAAFSSLIAGPLCSFLPGLGAGQAAVIGSQFYKLSQRTFLLMLGIIGTLVTGLNFVALYAINKPRSGVSVIVGKLLDINFSQLILLMVIMLIAGAISYLLILKISKKFIGWFEKVNYSLICKTILIILGVIAFFVSGIIGVVVLLAATFLGISANIAGIKKIQLMGCLMVPIILFYI
jgi:putative membrane protein